MSGPVYKMFHARWTEAWYQLSREQREAMFAKMTETGERLGAKQVIICDSSWIGFVTANPRRSWEPGCSLNLRKFIAPGKFNPCGHLA
jgi:hypothetical protein